MDFDIEGARKAGYSDTEIADHLAKQSGFDAAGARKAGYSDAEILGHVQGDAKSPQPQEEERSLTRSGAEGLWRSAASVGNTLLAPVRGLANLAAPEEATLSTLVDGKKRRTGALAPVAEYLDRIPEAMKWMDQENAGNPMSYGAGRLVGDIAMTAPIGGVAGAGIKAVGTRAGLPVLEKLGTSVATGGLRTGTPAATTLAGKAGNMAIRAGGGAINGGLSAGAIDPENATAGAAIGAVLPPAAAGTAKVLGAAGRGAQSIKRSLAPLSERNDPKILGRFINEQVGPDLGSARDALRQYKQTGPELAGYQPTTAEVARVPSLAALQRTATATDPITMNANATRAARNQEVLGNTLDDLAGRDGARAFTQDMRETTANRLYEQAYQKPIDPAALPKTMQKQIETLTQKPAMQAAMARARELAKNEGLDVTNPAGSLQGLHYVKTELDAMIREAATQNERRILTGVQGDLLKVMDNISPEYANARAEYAAMSKPVNQFDVLERVAQDSRTPAGNVTLNKFARAATDKTAQSTLRRPGVTMADLLEADQLGKLGSVRNTLEGIEFASNAGRGVGSDTVQKLATANRMGNVGMGGLLGRLPGAPVLGGLLSRGADAVYSGANQRLKEKLARGLLDPSEGLDLLEAAYLQSVGQAPNGILLRAQDTARKALPLAFKTAPVALNR